MNPMQDSCAQLKTSGPGPQLQPTPAPVGSALAPWQEKLLAVMEELHRMNRVLATLDHNHAQAVEKINERISADASVAVANHYLCMERMAELEVLLKRYF